jgi:hypothetical protein
MSSYRAPWFNAFRVEVGTGLLATALACEPRIHGTERGDWTWFVAADKVCGDEIPPPAAARHARPKVGAA